ncbi:MAG: hypothetical protein H7Z13_13500 [Ferruginibacter sp.]|nr:hypothetical protein [Ferruginibacter sp.]
MKQLLALMLLLSVYNLCMGQEKTTTVRKSQWVDLAATIGNSQGTAAISYVYSWKLGRKKKLEAGLGVRFTSMFGEKIDYTTAPAKLSRTNTTPFLIFFAGQKTVNWDTLTVQRPFVNSLNLSANFGYNFSSRFSAVFNIDLVGFTFGRKSSAILTSNGITKAEGQAKPAGFNALLTGDLDYGSLNSEFSLKYTLNDRWAVRGIYQFLFTEYKTTTIRQTAPDGTMVDRFRNKANNFGAGVSYQL